MRLSLPVLALCALAPANAATDKLIVVVDGPWQAFFDCAVNDLVRVRGYPPSSIKAAKDKANKRAAIEVRDLTGADAFSLAIMGADQTKTAVGITSHPTEEAIIDWQARAKETVYACAAKP